MSNKAKKLEELMQTRCAKCSSSGEPVMWCWNLPHCHCSVKTLREEIEGKCTNPMSVKEHIDNLLSK